MPLPEWWDRAPCKGLTDLFYPETGETTAGAKAVCSTCEYAAECRALGMPELHGVWGGTSERDRRRLRRTEPRACAQCGETFTPPKGGRNRKTCSDACARARQTERQRERYRGEPAAIRTAPRRHACTCVICGEPFQGVAATSRICGGQRGPCYAEYMRRVHSRASA